MKIDDIVKISKDLKPKAIGINRKYSIFIPFIEVDGDLHLLFEVRSKDLRSQPGDICYPGGKVEENEGPLLAAVRETKEELNLSDKQIEIITAFDYLVSPYGSIIHTNIGFIKEDIENIKPNKAEVDHIFTVPFDYFIDHEPQIYTVKFDVNRDTDFPYDLIENGKNYKFKQSKDKVMFYLYKDRVIWGFTAKMTNNLVKRIVNNL